ncbi:Stromal membrane-associated protein 1, partial [Clonorchis sinensis]
SSLNAASSRVMTGAKRDQEKLQSERHQLIIQELLRDEDNKYCVDCDAKGPRWASWNIGVFLCIRCAGIHRNLGVHISKVKSVNLDTWTVSQLATMRDMGNSRARAIYEARLPDNFRRPQTDSALEIFIRSKYEQKRYIAQEYVPAQPDVESLLKEIQRLEQANKKRHVPNTVSLGQSTAAPCKQAASQLPPTAPETQRQVVDLLGLEADTSTSNHVNSTDDIFGSLGPENMIGNIAPDSMSTSISSASQPIQTNATNLQGSFSNDLMGLDVTNAPVHAITTSGPISPTIRTNDASGVKTSKDAILALYQQNQQSSTPSVSFPAVTGIPGNAFGQCVLGGKPDSGWPLGNSSVGFPDKSAGELFGDLCSVKNTSKSNEFPCFTQSNFTQAPTTQNPSSTIPAFSQTNVPMSPGFAVWPDASKTYSHSGHDKSSVEHNPNPTSRTQFPINTAWNSPPLIQPAVLSGQVHSEFPAPTSYGSGLVGSASAAHQAYLLQVQRQLASLQLSGTVNNPQ